MAKKRTYRRRKGGLGDLLSNRVDKVIIRVRADLMRRGKSPNKFTEAMGTNLAKRQLCKEGHSQFCKGAETPSTVIAPSAEQVATASVECKAPKGKFCVPKAVATRKDKAGRTRLRPGCYRRLSDDAYICGSTSATPTTRRKTRRKKKSAKKSTKRTTKRAATKRTAKKSARKTTAKRKTTSKRRKSVRGRKVC